MELTLNRQTIEAEKLIGSAQAQLLLRAEALISGAGREEIEVLMSDACAAIGSVDVQTDRVVLDGAVRCQAAYRQASEKTARAVSAKTTLSHVFDMKGALNGMIARAECDVDDVRARYENGHMIFDISVSVRARVVSLAPVSLITSCDGADALQTDALEVRSAKTLAENAVSVRLSDKTALPAALDARCALMEWADVHELSARNEPGGIRLTGEVLMETLISGGAPNRPVALIKYALPIDQYVEMPEWLTDSFSLSARILNARTEVEQADGEDSLLYMEAEAEVVVTATGADQVTAVRDAYMPGEGNVSVETQTFDILENKSEIAAQEAFRSSVLAPEGAGAVGSVCAVRARANVGEVLTDGEKTSVSGVVNAQVIYVSASGDKLMRASADLPFEIGVNAALDENAWVRVQALGAEGNALMSDRIEIKCQLKFTADQSERKTVTAAREIALAENVKTRHGAVIVWPDEEDSVWTVARRYKVPVKDVQAAAGGAVRAGNPLVLRI